MGRRISTNDCCILQSMLNNIQEEDVMLLGDFNARVGSGDRTGDNPSWNGVRGCAME